MEKLMTYREFLFLQVNRGTGLNDGVSRSASSYAIGIGINEAQQNIKFSHMEHCRLDSRTSARLWNTSSDCLHRSVVHTNEKSVFTWQLRNLSIGWKKAFERNHIKDSKRVSNAAVTNHIQLIFLRTCNASIDHVTFLPYRIVSSNLRSYRRHHSLWRQYVLISEARTQRSRQRMMIYEAKSINRVSDSADFRFFSWNNARASSDPRKKGEFRNMSIEYDSVVARIMEVDTIVVVVSKESIRFCQQLTSDMCQSSAKSGQFEDWLDKSMNNMILHRGPTLKKLRHYLWGVE